MDYDHPTDELSFGTKIMQRGLNGMYRAPHTQSTPTVGDRINKIMRRDDTITKLVAAEIQRLQEQGGTFVGNIATPSINRDEARRRADWPGDRLDGRADEAFASSDVVRASEIRAAEARSIKLRQDADIAQYRAERLARQVASQTVESLQSKQGDIGWMGRANSKVELDCTIIKFLLVLVIILFVVQYVSYQVMSNRMADLMMLLRPAGAKVDDV